MMIPCPVWDEFHGLNSQFPQFCGTKFMPSMAKSTLRCWPLRNSRSTAWAFAKKKTESWEDRPGMALSRLDKDEYEKWTKGRRRTYITTRRTRTNNNEKEEEEHKNKKKTTNNKKKKKKKKKKEEEETKKKKKKKKRKKKTTTTTTSSTSTSSASASTSTTTTTTTTTSTSTTTTTTTNNNNDDDDHNNNKKNNNNSHNDPNRQKQNKQVWMILNFCSRYQRSNFTTYEALHGSSIDCIFLSGWSIWWIQDDSGLSRPVQYIHYIHLKAESGWFALARN